MNRFRFSPPPVQRLFKRTPLLACLLIGLMAAVSAAELPSENAAATDDSASNSQPNIVFFFADDQSPATLGCYGNPVIQTPNIDSLAKRGTRFQNAFVSQAICWVSRTTILTGLTGRTYGTPGRPEWARPEAVETLYPDLLRDAGYRTGYFGKWHAKMPQEFRREDHFDEFEAIGRNPYFKTLDDGSLRHETDLIVDRGIDFIKRQPKDKPFALNLWFNAAHAEDSDRRPGFGAFPWPPSTNGMYDDQTFVLPADADSVFASLPEALQISIGRERFYWRWDSDSKYQTNMRAYYRMISGIDNAIGRFMEALESQGLADNTIIVYSADNGYYMGRRGLAGKWSHFDEAIRVPMIIMDPRVETSRIEMRPVLNLDLPPTFLDIADVEIPTRYQGRSLVPLVRDEAVEDWREVTFHEHFAVRNRIPAFEGVQTDRWKYVRYFDHGDEFLHDLKNDPAERVNLIDDASRGEILATLRSQLDEMVTDYGGPLKPMNTPFQTSTVPYPEAAVTVSQSLNDDGNLSLFNGKNLNGWVGDQKYWSVRDGAITGVTDGSLKRNHFLTWKGNSVQNFDLTMEVKISEGGNSGIQYRGLMRPEIGHDAVSGYQCDIVADRPDYNGMLYEERGRRIISRVGQKIVIDPDGQPWIVDQWDVPPSQPDQWHQYRVVARANRLQHFIDDQMTVEVLDLDENGRSDDGVLGMQVHVGPAMTVQFKNLVLRPLPDDLPVIPADQVEIPSGSLGVKPQKKLPADWQPPVHP